jgi:hypothetical protein
VFDIIKNARSLKLYDHSQWHCLRGALVKTVMKLVAQQKADNFLTYGVGMSDNQNDLADITDQSRNVSDI